MGAIYGILIIFLIIISIVLMVVGLFLNNVLVFDSIALSILTATMTSYKLQLHPAFCLLIGIATYILFHVISRFSVGFWIISIAVSTFLALIVATIVWGVTGKDKVWLYVSLALSFFFILGLHIKTRD